MKLPIENREETTIVVSEKPSLIEKWKHLAPKITDEKQKRAGKNIIVFFALMLILTIVARGMSGATYAQVKTQTPSKAEIVEVVKGSATVQSSEVNEVKLETGLKVSKLFVSVGQAVKAGDEILRYDLETISEEVKKLEGELTTKEIDLSEKKLPKADLELLTKSAQKTLDGHIEEYNSTKSTGEGKISSAQQDVNAATSRLENAKAELQSAINHIPEPDELPMDISVFEQAVSQAEEELQTAKTQLETEKTQMNDSLKSLDKQIEEARESLEKAKKSDQQTKNQDEIDVRRKNLEIENLEKEINETREKIAKYKTIVESTGVVKAEQDGTIKKLPEEGETTLEGAIYSITNQAGSFEAEAMLSKDNAKKLKPGAKVDIEKGTGYYKDYYEGEIVSLSAPDENDQVTAKIKLPQGKWESGESINIQAVQKRETYETCVPLSALNSRQDGYFVLVIEQRSTILGTENVLVEYPVTVLAKDNEKAAVEGGIWQTPVVIESTKPITTGDRVRVME